MELTTFLLAEDSSFLLAENGNNLIVDRKFISYSPFTMSLVSEITAYQNEVRCKVKENDFNYTLNPSANKAGTSGSYIDAATGSDFHPYATMVGLYNDRDELLVIGKLARPYPIPPNTDVTIIVRWDS